MPVLSSNASYTLNDCTSSNTSACTATSDGSTTVINPTMSARLTTRGKEYSLRPRRDQGKAPPRVSPTPMTLSLLTRMGVGTGCGPRYGCSPRTTHTALGPSWARSTYVSHPPFLPLLLLTLYTQLMESRGNPPPLGTSNVRASMSYGPLPCACAHAFRRHLQQARNLRPSNAAPFGQGECKRSKQIGHQCGEHRVHECTAVG